MHGGEAMISWNTCPGDPSRLDSDNDGRPCERLCWGVGAGVRSGLQDGVLNIWQGMRASDGRPSSHYPDAVSALVERVTMVRPEQGIGNGDLSVPRKPVAPRIRSITVQPSIWA